MDARALLSSRCLRGRACRLRRKQSTRSAFFRPSLPQKHRAVERPVIDLRDAVALSILPRLSRGPLTNQLREAIRGGEATRGRAHATLDTLVQRLGIDAPPVRAGIGGARRLADRALDRRRALGVDPIPLDDSRYPDALAAIPDPPPVLWVRGQVAALATPSLGHVPARRTPSKLLGGWEPTWPNGASQLSAASLAAWIRPRIEPPSRPPAGPWLSWDPGRMSCTRLNIPPSQRRSRPTVR